MLQLQVDITGLQDARFLDKGNLCKKEKNNTFFMQGKDIDEVREHGVGFVVKHSPLKLVELNSDSSGQIFSL